MLTHNPEARILGDTDALIKEHDILGCDYIGIGAMPERYRSNAPEWVDYFAKDFETAAKKIRDAASSSCITTMISSSRRCPMAACSSNT